MRRSGLTLFAILALPAAAWACSVPVFRYALERWEPSKYQLLVFEGKATPVDPAERKVIEAAAARANVKLVSIDPADIGDASIQKIWDRDGKKPTLPFAILRYPDTGPEIPSAWAGPFTAKAVGPLFDSPARRQMFDRLTAGHAGVVLLLCSGNAKADAAARAFLDREVPAIAAKIDSPLRPEDGKEIRSELPLLQSFPIVEVERGAAEEPFVRMLLGYEEGLDKVAGPIAFPVFGRARLLSTLHGRDLEKPRELQRAIEFMCKACSCQAKELNPGLDLLTSGDWGMIFEAEKGPEPREAVPAAEIRPAPANLPAVENRGPPPPGYSAVEVIGDDDSEARSGRRRLLPSLAVGLVLASAVWLICTRRKPPHP